MDTIKYFLVTNHENSKVNGNRNGVFPSLSKELATLQAENLFKYGLIQKYRIYKIEDYENDYNTLKNLEF